MHFHTCAILHVTDSTKAVLLGFYANNKYQSSLFVELPILLQVDLATVIPIDACLSLLFLLPSYKWFSTTSSLKHRTGPAYVIIDPCLFVTGPASPVGCHTRNPSDWIESAQNITGRYAGPSKYSARARAMKRVLKA